MAPTRKLGCSTMPWSRGAATWQASPLLVRSRGVTLTMVAASGPVSYHWAPIENRRRVAAASLL
jgi:hypothetical protein